MSDAARTSPDISLGTSPDTSPRTSPVTSPGTSHRTGPGVHPRTALLDREALHASLRDPVLKSIGFLNEIMSRCPDAVSFAPGAPHPDPYADLDTVRYLDRFVSHAAAAPGRTHESATRLLYEYGPARGIVNAVVAAALRRDQGIDADPDSLVITVGAQEAMLLTLRALIALRRTFWPSRTPASWASPAPPPSSAPGPSPYPRTTTASTSTRWPRPAGRPAAPASDGLVHGPAHPLTPRVESIVEERLDAMAALGGQADLVEQFALPVPPLVICELLGVPYAERSGLQRNSAILFELDATAEQASTAMEELDVFLTELAGHRRRSPGDDLLSEPAQEGELSTAEIAGVGALLLSAGHETTAGSLGLGVFAPLSHPDQLARLTADPSLAAAP